MSEPVFKHIASFGARAVALAIDFALLAAIHLIMFFLLAGRLLNEVVHLELLAILTVYSWFVVSILCEFCFFAHGLFYPVPRLVRTDNREDDNEHKSRHAGQRTGSPFSCLFALDRLHFILRSLCIRFSLVGGRQRSLRLA